MSLKNIFKKSVATTMIASILLGNCSLCGGGISKVIAENTTSPDIITEIKNEKYVEYKEGEISGVAVHSSLSVYPNQNQDTYLPTETVEIELNLPSINGVLPEKALVVEATTESTTGEDINTKFNQNYDSNSGLLNISYENIPNQEGQIYSSYNENAKDEFEIIYTYPEQAYTEDAKETELNYILDVKMSFKTEIASVTSRVNRLIKLTEKENKEDLTTFNITELKENIYKGFLYSNVQNKTKYDTEYKTISTFCVLNSSIMNETIMNLEESKIILNDDENTEVSLNGNIVYKATSISKYEFDKILGQDGFIEIYNGEEVIATVKYIDVEGGKKLATIYFDGNIEILNEEEVVAIIEYSKDLTSLKIKVSKPKTEGFMHFENTNVIKPADDYGCKVEEIKSVVTKSKVNEYESIAELLLLEPATKIQVETSNSSFSTLQKSTTTLTIKLDDTNASTELFNSPTITIKLPEGLVGGNLSSPEIVNGNGLEIEDASADGNIITIKLKGEQKAYDLTNVSGGTSIVMDIENIDFKDTIPTHTDKIEVTCLQDKETVKVNCNINIVSKAGLLILSKLSNYDNNGNVLSSIDNTTKTVNVGTNVASREAEYTIDLVNNYDENLTNVKIIRKIGYSNNQIKSTFITTLVKPVQISDKNAKVYYTTNEQADYSDNSWTEEFTAEAKAYKVVLNNNELVKADNIQIKEYIKIPQNLRVNQESYLNTNITYDYKTSNLEDDITLSIATPKDELQTKGIQKNTKLETSQGEIIPVNVSIVPITSYDYVHSGQIVTYKVQIVNNGERDLTNLKLTDIIPDNAIYTYEEEREGNVSNYIEIVKDPNIKEKTCDIDLLKAGESKEFEIMLTMADVSEEQDILNKVDLKYNDQTVSIENKLKLRPALVSIDIGTNKDYIHGLIYDFNDVVEYNVKVKNISGEKLKNLQFRYTIPENLTYIEGGTGIYDEFEGYSIDKHGNLNNGVFEYNLKELKENEEIAFVVRCKVNKLEKTYTTNIDSVAEVNLDGDIYQSDIQTITTSQSDYTINLESNIKEGTILKVGDTVIYTVKVLNIGDRASLFTVKDNIPSEIEVNKIEYGIENEELKEIITSKQDIELVENIEKNETFIVKITGTVRDKEVDKDTTLDLVNTAKVVIETYEIESNKITLKLEVKAKEKEEAEGVIPEIQIPTEGEGNDTTTGEDTNKPEDNEDNSNEENKNEDTVAKEYNISGLAWLDANKNGQKEGNENLLSDVRVSLVNKQTGNFAINEQGNRITTVTNSNGEYKFENLKEGTYLVLFEFDTNSYTVTTYKKSEIEERLNSDAIVTTVTIDGTKKLAAITDEIALISNKENIDIGLIENAKFDLSLDKQITKITVINSQGTEITEFEEGDTAKVDLVAKYMNTANVIVNYKFTIRNEGEVTGYVNSLVDDLPSGLQFSSDLNKNWYKGNDGKLYIASLSGTPIKPGESLEVELVLTKDITEESTGVFPNNAELGMISNLENIQEKEEALENNQSSATLIISIKTGSVILYTGITILCIAILAVGAYIIKKKVLNRGI